MCYEFVGMELLTKDWLNTIAAWGTLAATIAIAWIAHQFQQDQSVAATVAAGDQMQVQINRLLFRMRHAEEMLRLGGTMPAPEDASDRARISCIKLGLRIQMAGLAALSLPMQNSLRWALPERFRF